MYSNLYTNLYRNSLKTALKHKEKAWLFGQHYFFFSDNEHLLLKLKLEVAGVIIPQEQNKRMDNVVKRCPSV